MENVDYNIKTAKNLDMECQVITKFIWYPLFEIEVDFHKGVILFYLEVGVGWMKTLRDPCLSFYHYNDEDLDI